MKIKKVLLFCCFICASFVVFSNGTQDSGVNKNAKSKTTLKVLGYGEESSAEGRAFVRICNEFASQNPDIEFSYEMFGDEKYHEQRSAKIVSSDIPDIAYMGADERWGSAWKNAAQQIDNTPYMNENINVNLIPEMGPSGERYYIPLGGANLCSVIGVNIQLLNNIGGRIPKTYDEWKLLARLCRANDIECLSLHGEDSWIWGSCLLSVIVARVSGDAHFVQKAVRGEKKFTDKEFVTSLQTVAQLVKDGIISTKTVTTDLETALSNFRNGKSLMYLSGQWDFGRGNLGKVSNVTRLITFPPVPKQTGCNECVASAVQVGYGITAKGASNPKTLEAAKKWLDYFYSNENVSDRLLNVGGISAPILKNFNYPEDIDPFINQKAELLNIELCDVIDSYLTGAPNEALNTGLQELVKGKTTPQALAQKIETLVRQ